MRLLSTDLTNYLYDTVVTVFSTHLTAKTISGIVFITWTFMFDVGKHESLIALLLLIVLDFIFGIGAARVNGVGIKSSKIRRSAFKIATYYLMISAGFLTEKGITFLPLDETILAFLVLTELISILENAGRCGFAIPKKLLAQLEDYRSTQ